MTFESMPWKAVLSDLREAIFHAETVDILMRKTVDIINAAYHVDSILWVCLGNSPHESWRAYSTTSSWKRLKGGHSGHQNDDTATSADGDLNAQPHYFSAPSHSSDIDSSAQNKVVRRFRPDLVPDWLSRQQNHPQPAVLDDGNLIIPITDRIPLTEQGLGEHAPPKDSLEGSDDSRCFDSASNHPLRFVFQLRRSPHSRQRTLQSSDSDLYAAGSIGAAMGNSQTSVEWEPEALIRLQAIGEHLLLACDALTFKRRFEQSQRHVSLLSRTSHILNTPVHPDRAIRQILAEIGQRLKSDRITLFDLRHRSVTVLAEWERPRQHLKPFDVAALRYVLWESAIEIFLEEGASYLTLQFTNGKEKHLLNDEFLYDWLRQTGAGSALVLPMFIREEFFGVLALLSQRPERHYTVDELQMAQQSTDQLSIALTIVQHVRSPATGQSSLLTQQSAVSQQSAFIDDLTRLPNREALEKELDALSTTSALAFCAPFSLIICDIDYFKLINDTYGHDVGDRILLRVAQQLQHQLRRTTPMYRYGGEEFVIILEQTSLTVAADVADRLRQSLRSMPLRTEDEVLTVTASFGVAQLISEADRHALDVLRRAEAALFSAKRHGRDRVSIQ